MVEQELEVLPEVVVVVEVVNLCLGDRQVKRLQLEVLQEVQALAAVLARLLEGLRVVLPFLNLESQAVLRLLHLPAQQAVVWLAVPELVAQQEVVVQKPSRIRLEN